VGRVALACLEHDAARLQGGRVGDVARGVRGVRYWTMEIAKTLHFR
jgi:hypothetical protein